MYFDPVPTKFSTTGTQLPDSRVSPYYALAVCTSHYLSLPSSSMVQLEYDTAHTSSSMVLLYSYYSAKKKFRYRSTCTGSYCRITLLASMSKFRF